MPTLSPPHTTRTEPLIVVTDDERGHATQPIQLYPLRIGAVVYDRPNGIQTASIEAGTIVSIISMSDDWIRVAWYDETTPDIDAGWIRRSFVQHEESNHSSEGD